MIKTASFTCNLPFEQFKACLVDCYDNHEIQYNDEIIEKNAKKLWDEYGEDILMHIEGHLCPEVSIDWDSDLDIYAGLLKQYIIETKCNLTVVSEWKVTFEEYWKELMMEAMEANAEGLFETDGSCNIYGEREVR